MDIGITPHVPAPEYDDNARGKRINYLELTERDKALLLDLEDLVESNMDEIVDRFYEYLLSEEETRDIFADDAMIQRLKDAQREYLRQSLRGPYDREYFLRRWKIGYIHNKIKLEPHWFIGAFQLYHRILYPMILERYRDDAQAVTDHILALDKIMNLDQQLGIDSYMAHYVGTMDQLRLLNVQIQEATEAKSQFLANMSHEFRTPLNAIIGFTEVLKDYVAEPMINEKLEYLDEIHKAGQVLLRLVNDILDLSKVEAGRLELFYQTFPIEQAIRESVTAIRAEAEKRGLTIDIDLPKQSVLINADPIRFKQILYNLLTNAIKFTHKGGISIKANIEDESLHLRVRDTGIGIRPEDQERIFDEFSQVDSGNRKQYEGTGLGLSVSRRLVETHNGKIWVESEFGEGSTFHVLIPLRPQLAKTRKAG